MTSLRLPRLATALAAVVVAAMPFASLTAADAAVVKPLDIVKVYFDPAGTDRPTNAGYNQEYIQVRNTGTKALNLTGYRIVDAGPKSFAFPKNFTLAKGATVTIRAGKGTNSKTTLYWQNKGYVWNNTGDVARLMSPKGAQLERCDFRNIRGLNGTKVC